MSGSFDLRFDFGQDQTQEMRVSPRLILANHILQLSSQELQQLINDELSENPALEIVEKPTCQVCGTELQGSICPRCLARQKGPEPETAEDWAERYGTVRDLAVPSSDEVDPLTRVAAESPLGERLYHDLCAMVPEEDHPIAEYLVGSLDEDGYLQVDVAEVAEECGATVERVQHVLARLQTLDPVGIGARDLRECLLIQLDYLEHEEGLTHPLAREIVLFHLPEMAERRYQQIARSLNAPVAVVTEACEFIRRELNPYPSRQGESFRPGSGERRTARVLPDIIIARGEHGFEVDVVESQKFELQISPTYRDLLARMEKDPEQFAAEEREHVRHHVSRARLFLDSVRQRRETMRRIAECLVDEQRDFLERGVRSIKPLTRAAVAEKLGLHESTVSRATAKKYAMLPDRRVIPLSDFFTPSLGPKDVIREIIANENRPLTDAEIATRLQERGIVIARRTVAKYRAEMGILPAGLR